MPVPTNRPIRHPNDILTLSDALNDSLLEKRSISSSISVQTEPEDKEILRNTTHQRTNTRSTSLLTHEKDTHRTIATAVSGIWLWFTNWWGAEFTAWLISAVCITSIVIILLVQNGRGLPQWPFLININTLISVLSQVGQSALMIPVSSCIGQLKWLWFTGRKHRLSDFDAFDNASRGPWSSLLLIGKTHASHLVSLGALLTIMSLAFQPFVQQAVSFPQRLTPTGNATISSLMNLTLFTYSSPGIASATSDIGPSILAAIYEGVSNETITLSNVQASCVTGNCTWETYDSLAVCAQPLVNLTQQLTLTPSNNEFDCVPWSPSSKQEYKSNCEYSLPNGVILAANATGTMNISASPSTLSIAYPNEPLILDLFVIYRSYRAGKVEALEIAMRFCGQTYNTSVYKGQTLTQVLDTWGTIDASAFNDDEYFNQNVFSSNTDGQNPLVVGQLDFTTLKDYLYTIFNDQNNKSIPLFVSESLTSTSTINELRSLGDIVNNVAISLSNSLRSGPGNVPILGTALSVETYVSIRWEWLTLPVSLVFLTLVFLVATMIRSEKHGIEIWKTSSLTVLGGLNNETRTHLGSLSTMTILDENSKGIMVEMERNNDGWNLV